MAYAPKDHEEENLSEALTPEERSELSVLLSDYMTDGKLDFERAKADNRYAKFESRINPDQIWFWTSEWQAKQHEAEEDLKAGRYKSFDSMDDMLADLLDE